MVRKEAGLGALLWDLQTELSRRGHLTAVDGREGSPEARAAAVQGAVCGGMDSMAHGDILRPLRVLVTHRPPLVSVDAEGGNGTEPSLSGFLIDLLPRLLEKARVPNPYEFFVYPGVRNTGET